LRSQLRGAATLFFAIAGVSSAAPISGALLDAVERQESGNGVLVGDGGRSRGPFMLQSATVELVNRLRDVRRQPVWSYEAVVTSWPLSRAYAADYLAWLAGELRAALGRDPFASELYAAYNLGFEKFLRLGLNLWRVEPTARRAALNVERAVDAAIFAALRARGQQLAATRPAPIQRRPE